jgi:hypothetical protein
VIANGKEVPVFEPPQARVVNGRYVHVLIRGGWGLVPTTRDEEPRRMPGLRHELRILPADSGRLYPEDRLERGELTLNCAQLTRDANPLPTRVIGVPSPDDVDELAPAVSLHFMHYNFARVHKSLKSPYPRTPAMAAGIADHVWTLEEIAGLLD